MFLQAKDGYAYAQDQLTYILVLQMDFILCVQENVYIQFRISVFEYAS